MIVVSLANLERLGVKRLSLYPYFYERDELQIRRIPRINPIGHVTPIDTL